MNDDNNEDLFLGVFQIHEADRIRAEFKDREVIVEVRHNEETCTTGGCTPTVELWGKPHDRDVIVDYFQSENRKHYGGLDINKQLLDEVFDPTKDKVTCQACGHEFDPKAQECPDCGLFYG